ncbi:hypothetical protein QYM36_016811 [Artemia franciscana]|uniref:PiggyBac transposable element-derived protein domain-containing protein n=1 Tax=Artemia franciscana TaxID=6661 RepID=A0AA88KW75_ARTSF|nr:hypothetical protein QYM36_016811 [Artemia franciscana]
MRTEPEERQSIDEQITPFKERSVMRLNLPNKPYRWGFKVFTRAGRPKIFFDDWLSSVELVVHLKEIGYDCVGTIRQNHPSGCELMEEKKMKRFRLGHIDWRVEKLTEVCLVRWYDNKAVTLVSYYVAVEPKDTCRCLNSSDKKYVEIETPAVIKEYNKYMGGVD